MKKRALRVVKGDAGMSTAEYAVGTIGATGLAGLLIKLLTSDEVRDGLMDIIEKAFSWFMG